MEEKVKPIAVVAMTQLPLVCTEVLQLRYMETTY
jgi:hypothetical protein